MAYLIKRRELVRDDNGWTIRAESTLPDRFANPQDANEHASNLAEAVPGVRYITYGAGIYCALTTTGGPFTVGPTDMWVEYWRESEPPASF